MEIFEASQKPHQPRLAKGTVTYHHPGWDTSLTPSEEGSYFLLGIQGIRKVRTIPYESPKGLMARIGSAVRVFRASMPIL